MESSFNSYSDFIQQYINHPQQYQEQTQILKMIEYLQVLCSHKVQLTIHATGFRECAFCLNPINLCEKTYQLSCYHTAHQQCIEYECLQKDQNMLQQNLIGIKCRICGKELTSLEAISGFEKQKLEAIYFQQAQKIDKQLQEENKQQALTKQFDCDICMNTLPVTENCITLSCDHKFCKECLADFLENLIKEGQVKKNELVCPQSDCKMPIEQIIIQYVISKEMFDKYINFQFKHLEPVSDNQIFVRCPTVKTILRQIIFILAQLQYDF